MPSTLLTTKEACAFLRVCSKTLHSMWKRKDLRRVQARGDKRAVRWPLAELERYVTNNMRTAK